MEVRQLPYSDYADNHLINRFIITGSGPAFANALRRIILAEVPTIAIEEVIIIENTLPLFDEYIAHRLGLIPLNSDIDDLNMIDECDNCDGAGCSQCTVGLGLTRESGQDATETIYSSDLEASDPRVYAVNDNIPIMKMGKGQRLILEAIARFGTGKEHAKFQPVSSVGYQYMPIIEIRPGTKFTKEVADACPRGILQFDDKNQSINLSNPLKCNLCMECVIAAEKDSITVREDKTQIIFLVESNGSLPVENIVIKASDILHDKAEDFIESLNSALEDYENDPKLRTKIISFERIQIEKNEEK
jgi:DNA-directed RNA polymerase subunit D